MKRVTIINDLHIGVQRVSGTTIQSAIDLRAWAQRNYATLLRAAGNNTTVIVNGDLADSYEIPLAEALQLYIETGKYLDLNLDSDVVYVLGNHDLSKDDSKLGGIAFIGHLLKVAYPTRFQLVSKPSSLRDGIHIIPHVVNQEAFDAALAAVPGGTKFLFLHCNYDSSFASQADHSLNLPRATAKELKERGITMILGHEHQGRTLMGGSVVIVGNQFPTSISDCLAHGSAQKDGVKKFAQIVDVDGGVELLPYWDSDGADGYAEIDWQDLTDAPAQAKFIKVVGKATAEQASEVIRKISIFRQSSPAFVVSNGVEIEQLDDLGDLTLTVDSIKAINVLDLLWELLEPKQVEALKKLVAAG